MPRIRLTEPGFQTYTGEIGTIRFEDGVSVEEVSQADANVVGASMRCVAVDTDHALGPTQKLLDTRGDTPEVTRSITNTQPPEEKAEEPAKIKKAEKPVKEEEKAVSDQPTEKFPYTRESLEEIADARGIAGLRSFAVQYGINGVSIKDIIDKLMDLKVAK